MTLQDVLVLSIIIVVLGLIVYFSFFKKDKNPCGGCPYAKKCDKNNQKKDYCNNK